MLVQGWSGRHHEHGRRSWSVLRSRPCGEGGHEDLRRWWPVPNRSMRTKSVVMSPPAFDDDLSLFQGVEDLTIEEFVGEAGVEGLDIAVLPRAARGNIRGLGANSFNLVLHGLRDELGAIVRTNVARHAAQDEQVGEDVDHIGRVELSRDPDREAFPGELVDDIERPELATVSTRPVKALDGCRDLVRRRSERCGVTAPTAAGRRSS
jgi:hypothetical protein